MSLCENCHRPATLAWPAYEVGAGNVAAGTYTAYTCDGCQPAHSTGAPPRSLAPVPVPGGGLPALLDRESAAAYLSLSTDAFDRQVRPYVKVRMIGSKPMFTPAELDRFAASGAQPL